MQTPLTSVLLVLVTGMVAGHLLMPSRATATLGQRAAFVVVLVASGGFAGWRTGLVLRDRRAGGAVLSTAAGMSATILLAWLAYGIVHGG